MRLNPDSPILLPLPMLKQAVAAVWIALKTVFCSCHADQKNHHFSPRRSHYTVSRLARLPTVVGESSGLAYEPGTQTVWTHNDGGSPADLFGLDTTGQLRQTIPLALPNVDWEDLARDPSGRLYVGDFGNNGNNRRNLTIYRLRPDQPARVDTIRFRYADQTRFPPGRDSLNFDCEAFFYHADSLYLFSKNRGSGPVTVYALPARPGTFIARPVGQLRINRMVTGAAISPSGKRFALLTYGKILTFDLVPGDPLLSHPADCIRFSHAQTEGITFLNETTLIVSNEQGRLFKVSTLNRPTPNRIAGPP